MTDRINRGLVLLSVKLEPQTHEQLLSFAEQNDLKVSTAARMLIEQAFLEGGAVELEKALHSKGYREGMNAAKHETALKLQKLKTLAIQVFETADESETE